VLTCLYPVSVSVSVLHWLLQVSVCFLFCLILAICLWEAVVSNFGFVIVRLMLLSVMEHLLELLFLVVLLQVNGCWKINLISCLCVLILLSCLCYLRNVLIWYIFVVIYCLCCEKIERNVEVDVMFCGF